jgi:hypothetical protein
MDGRERKDVSPDLTAATVLKQDFSRTSLAVLILMQHV